MPLAKNAKSEELKVVRKTRFERNIVALKRLKEQEQSNVLRKPETLQSSCNIKRIKTCKVDFC